MKVITYNNNYTVVLLNFVGISLFNTINYNDCYTYTLPSKYLWKIVYLLGAILL